MFDLATMSPPVQEMRAVMTDGASVVLFAPEEESVRPEEELVVMSIG